jgi:amino acid transporter
VKHPGWKHERIVIIIIIIIIIIFICYTLFEASVGAASQAP